MANLYFVNEHTNRRFRVINMNKETNEVTLEGEYGSFVEKYDKERFKEMGYKLVKVEDDLTPD